MITRLTGTLESVGLNRAEVALSPIESGVGAGIVLEVLLPTYLADRLAAKTGRAITLHTRAYLESQGQGTSFVPRLIGFGSVRERAFFELFTTVKGVGTRKALRALAAEPTEVARAIAARDATWLCTLPEIGKRMAETVVAELSGKLEAFVGASSSVEAKAGARPGPGGPQREAVEALIALGEGRGDAERLVQRAVSAREGLESAEQIVTAALALR